MHLQRYEYVKGAVKGKTVLDVGCGECYGVNLLRENAKFIAGVDYNKNILSRAKQKYGKEINLVAGDCLSRCFKKDTFDAIVSFEVIEHLKETHVFLKTVTDILKSNGIFYLSTLNRSVEERIRGGRRQRWIFHNKEFNKSELKECLKEYFKDVQLLGHMRKPKSSLHIFLKQLDWFNMRHMLPDQVKTKLMENTYNEKDNGNLTIKDFTITDKIVRQAPILIAVCKNPMKDKL